MTYGELLPTPDAIETVKDVIAGMPQAFDAQAAGELAATIQFDITDEEPGDYHVTIDKGSCAAYAGAHPSPTATIMTPADVWLKIVRGEMNATTAFMTRKLKASGDMNLLMNMAKLFRAGGKGS